MYLILPLIGLWVDKSRRYRILREAMIYQRLDPYARHVYRVPAIISRRWPLLLALALLLAVIDAPARLGWLLLSTLAFIALLLARAWHTGWG